MVQDTKCFIYKGKNQEKGNTNGLMVASLKEVAWTTKLQDTY
jgi:hypothetical protein